MKFAVVGGDLRLIKMADSLAAGGHDVKVFAGCGKTDLYRNVAEAVRDAEFVILPVPITSDGEIIASSEKRCGIRELIGALRPGQTVFGGKADREFVLQVEKAGATFEDYAIRESFAVGNARLTAEGTLGILIEELPCSIYKAEILLVGYGRIGKMLSTMLRELGAKVTVSARKEKDKVWICENGCYAADSNGLINAVAGKRAVINTVPHRLIDSAILQASDKDTLFIDLASKPGGIDFAEASKLGIKTIWALGLPGKTAPESAGEIIKTTIYNIISERKNAK